MGDHKIASEGSFVVKKATCGRHEIHADEHVSTSVEDEVIQPRTRQIAHLETVLYSSEHCSHVHNGIRAQSERTLINICFSSRRGVDDSSCWHFPGTSSWRLWSVCFVMDLLFFKNSLRGLFNFLDSIMSLFGGIFVLIFFIF